MPNYSPYTLTTSSRNLTFFLKVLCVKRITAANISVLGMLENLLPTQKQSNLSLANGITPYSLGHTACSLMLKQSTTSWKQSSMKSNHSLTVMTLSVRPLLISYPLTCTDLTLTKNIKHPGNLLRKRNQTSINDC